MMNTEGRPTGVKRTYVMIAATSSALLFLALDVVGYADADPGALCPDTQGPCARDVAGYFSELAGAGINSSNIAVGDGICTYVAHGGSTVMEADRVRSANPELSLIQGNVAVDSALLNLCPQLVRNDGTGAQLLPLQ
jgi:hypothetical protein